MSASRRVPPASVLRRSVVGLAWLASVAGAVLLVVAVPFGGAGLSGAGFAPVFAGLAVAIVVYATVGAILILRRPGNLVGPVLMAAAMVIVLTFLGFVFGAVLTVARGEEDVLAGLMALLGALGIVPVLIVAGPALALVFPDGHLPGPRWRWPAGAIAVAVAIATLLVAVRPGPINVGLANNPLGIGGVAWLETMWDLGVGLGAIALPCALLVALAGTIARFRRAHGVERQQLKWFVAANVTLIVFVLASIADDPTQTTVFDLLFAASLPLPPIAIGIAILRYRLYDIDRIISRTLAYTALTATLAIVYVAAFVGLQATLTPITSTGGSLAVAASTLVVLALFQPLRRRLQSAMDRRFNRSTYDAPRIVEAFAARLRDEVDLGMVRAEVLATVDATVQPNRATVWLREPVG